MRAMNLRLRILQAQYDAMKVRADFDPRVITRYEQLIEAEYRKTGQATSLNAHLESFGTRCTLDPKVPAGAGGFVRDSVRNWTRDHRLTPAA